MYLGPQTDLFTNLRDVLLNLYYKIISWIILSFQSNLLK